MITNFENWLEGTYPIKITALKKISSGLLISARSDNRTQNYLPQATELSAERLLFIHTGILHLNKNGFPNAQAYMETKTGLPFAQTENENFTMSIYHPENGFSFDNRSELSAAARLLAQMHLAGRGFTEEAARNSLEKYGLPYTVKCSLGNTPETFARRLGELKRFRKIAAKGNGDFDYGYLNIADYYCQLGDTLLSQLESSPYAVMVEEGRRAGCLCHRDFTGHNTVKCDPLPLITNFENMSIELPVYDVANLLRRRLRKCNWDLEEAFFVLEEYSKQRPLSSGEICVLKILLQFPQKLWRIVNKYYNSKRGRYEKTGLAKLAEITQEREPMSEFIKQF
jgi:spore coat protein I